MARDGRTFSDTPWAVDEESPRPAKMAKRTYVPVDGSVLLAKFNIPSRFKLSSRASSPAPNCTHQMQVKAPSPSLALVQSAPIETRSTSGTAASMENGDDTDDSSDVTMVSPTGVACHYLVFDI